MSKEKHKYEEVLIKDIYEYVEFLKGTDDIEFFRGQSDQNWALRPKIARKFTESKQKNSWITTEAFILEDFQRFAIPYLKDKPSSDLEWLILGQHYGLPTRLLDWTANPLKALFFAVNENFDQDGVVYFLSPLKVLTSVYYKMDLQSIHHFFAFYPKMFDQRIVSQDALFTVFPLPSGYGIFHSLEDSDYHSEAYEKLLKIIIPREHKNNLLKELDRVGINNKSLFPDLEGLSRYLTWIHNLD